MRSVLRLTARVVAVMIAVLLVPAVAAAVSASAAFGALYAPGPDRDIPAAAPVPHDPAKPTAVVVVGDRGPSSPTSSPRTRSSRRRAGSTSTRSGLSVDPCR